MPNFTPASRAQWPSLHDITITPWTQSQRLRDPARRLLFPRWAIRWREDVIAAIRASENYTPAPA